MSDDHITPALESKLRFKIEQNLGLGLSLKTAAQIIPAMGNISLPIYELPDHLKIIPFGIPDGNKPPPISLPYDLEDDDIVTSLVTASRNVAVIQYQQAPYFKGTGFFIGPDTILTAAHVAEFFIQGTQPSIWVNYNDGRGQAGRRTFVDSAYVLKSWKTGEAKSETDIGILKLKFPHNNFAPVTCSKLDINDASKSGAESPALKVLNKTGGPLKLLSFFDQNPKGGLAKRGLQITTGSYIAPAPRTAIAGHILGGHNIRSYKGWSGAAVLQTHKQRPSEQVVVGVHVHGAAGLNLFAGFSDTLIKSLNTIAKGKPPTKKLWRNIWDSKDLPSALA